jgi:hypothetical protein
MLDIDSVSLASAQANIDRNGLSERITLLCADTTGPILLPLLKDTATSCVTHTLSKKSYRDLPWNIDLISACVTHHFMQAQTTEEATQSAAAKELLPNAVRSPIHTIPKNIIFLVRFAPVPTL